MGSILDDDLRRPPRSEWEPTNVGAVKDLRRESSVTLLVERGGRWEYGPEIPVQVSLNELECVPLPGGSSALYWSGIQVRMSKQNLPDPSRRHYVTAALLPPSFLWNTEAPLLPGISRKDPGWRDGLGNLAAGATRFSDLAFDPFEPDSEYLVARLGDLTRPHWAEEQSAEVGEGFLLVRSRNRKSAEKRKWMLALCPALPEEVTAALEQSLQPYLESVLAGSVDDCPPPRQRHADQPGNPEARQVIDWQDRRGMSQGFQYHESMDIAQLCLQAAVRQSLARADGSSRTLEKATQIGFCNLYRDWDGRETRKQGVREQRRLAEAAYPEFIQLQPDCDQFRPRERLDMTLLKGAARHRDPERFRQFLRKRTLQTKNTPSA